MHARNNFGLRFKHPRVSEVNRMATRTFREKKYNNNKADSFFRLNFNVYINVDRRERARARDKKQRRPISLEEKRENFIAVVRKWEMLAATEVKMSGCEKKKKLTGTNTKISPP